MSRLTSTALPLLIAIMLSACGGLREEHGFLPGDSAPPDVSKLDLASIPNATPQKLPKSKTGNQTYSVYGKRYRPLESANGFKQTGLASWYGMKFHGRRTSSGEPYDVLAMTAAHRTLPLPSFVRVTNQENGRSVIVKVNDRGPFITPKKRVIDLSYVAAAKLDIVGTGTAPVLIEAITAPPATKSTRDRAKKKVPGKKVTSRTPSKKGVKTKSSGTSVFVQLGAFADKSNAMRLIEKAKEASIRINSRNDTGVLRVLAGPFLNVDKAMQKKLEIDRMLGTDGRVVFQ